MDDAGGILGMIGTLGQGDATAWGALVCAVAALAGAAVLWNRHERLKRRHRELAHRFARVEMDTLRMRQLLYAQRAERTLAGRNQTPRHSIQFMAEWGEDLFLWDLFEGQASGTYLEVGAYDGFTLSVTYPFEAVGWTGVLIEGLPDRFELCRARRPGSVVVHAAVSKRGSSGTTEFHRVPGDDQLQMLSYLANNAPHERLLATRDRQVETVKVPLTTVDAVLNEFARPRGIGQIDFAVIDVEGGEKDLLDGFDLEHHRPRVLVIEDLYKGRDSSMSDLLAKRGYSVGARIGRNQVFVRNDEPALLARCRQLAAVHG